MSKDPSLNLIAIAEAGSADTASETSLVADTRREEAKERPARRKDLDGIRVLVADDEPELLDIYKRFLQKSGFQVFTAEDGSEAVSKFIELGPEVIILDYRMPGSDGIEAAGEILSMKSSAKIIMLTADETVLEEAERIGVELFLEKPVLLASLLDSVKTLLTLKSSSAIISR